MEINYIKSSMIRDHDADDSDDAALQRIFRCAFLNECLDVLFSKWPMSLSTGGSMMEE